MKDWTLTYSNRPQPAPAETSPAAPPQRHRNQSALQRLAQAAKVAAPILLGLAMLAAPVQAEVLVTPFAGFAFAGDTDDSKLTYGGSITFQDTDGVLGLAADFGYSPDFFGSSRFGDNNVTTLMANLVFMAPGPARVYASGGAGLLKTQVRDATGFFNTDSNDFGIDVGGGVLFFPGTGSIGVQGDIRYFRALTDPQPDDEFDVDFGELSFWRGTVGLTIRF